MSIKYFTGCNNVVGGGKNQHTGTTTGLSVLGHVETAPADTVDGVDVKPGTTSKYTRILNKVFSKTTDSIGKSFANNVGCLPAYKTRKNHLKGKYELGKMWKYRKTLKKLLTATGVIAQASSKGERNMYNGKNNGCVANVKHSKASSGDYPLYPMNQVK